MQVNPLILSDGRSIAAYVIFFASYFVFALGKFPGLKSAWQFDSFPGHHRINNLDAPSEGQV